MTAEEKWDKLRAHVAAIKLHESRTVWDYDYDVGFYAAYQEIQAIIRRLDNG